MIKAPHAKTVSEYLTICDNIAASGKMLFRGQTFDYPGIVPSLFRLNEGEVPATAGDDAARLYMECYSISSWELVEAKRQRLLEDSYGDAPNYFSGSVVMPGWQGIDPYSDDWPPVGGFNDLNYIREDFVAMLEADFLKEESLRLYQDGFLQHYGVPTRTLDVSYDPIVALWFATHQLVTGDDGSRNYETIRNGTPVVYIFPLAGAEVVDLQKVHCHEYDPTQERIPYFGLRGVQQKGGLYYGATRESPDLRPHVAYQFSFSEGIWDVNALGSRCYTAEMLFPPPDQDLFYRELLKKVSNPKERYYPLRDYVI